ncbi:MAG: hypothetical protein R2749_00955 [Acidimicrobiales bacterium]
MDGLLTVARMLGLRVAHLRCARSAERHLPALAPPLSPGRWFGQAAARFGLDASFDDGAFVAVLAGIDRPPVLSSVVRLVRGRCAAMT